MWIKHGTMRVVWQSVLPNTPNAVACASSSWYGMKAGGLGSGEDRTGETQSLPSPSLRPRPPALASLTHCISAVHRSPWELPPDLICCLLFLLPTQNWEASLAAEHL